MKRVELSEKELTIVAEVIESSVSELKTEIGHTDRREYRQELKEREKVLEDVLGRLHSSAQP